MRENLTKVADAMHLSYDNSPSADSYIVSLSQIIVPEPIGISKSPDVTVCLPPIISNIRDMLIQLTSIHIR